MTKFHFATLVTTTLMVSLVQRLHLFHSKENNKILIAESTQEMIKGRDDAPISALIRMTMSALISAISSKQGLFWKYITPVLLHGPLF